ncbi:MAG TPA: ankyrin repeat domain-containing protein [Tepidisphaeraceae bacterium]|jgi:ankyrin repeat protein|nr:ankyrin repeat domain-containing protein [Tepidisphaeraceae bacterium]
MASYDDLIAAVNAGDDEKVKALLEENPKLASRPPGSPSVMLAAVYRGRADLVAMLRPHLELDVFEAAALGETGRVKELINNNQELLRQYSTDGWTALHLAAFMGHCETAEALLGVGADLAAFSQNQMANQPLHAALAGKTDRPLVQMLLERGADAKARAGAGVTPLHLAASRGDDVFCDLLISKGADPASKMDDGTTPDVLAAKRGYPAVAERLRRHLR